MARAERILAIDIGATSIKVGEFEYPKEGVSLIGFTHREYEEELTESTRSVVVAGLLRQMLVENNFTSHRAMISISGQAAFTRFVKLPPVAEEESRVRQIVEFEARQNVPFPMEEVIWDYQLIANPEAEEMDVMFVVIKNEIVEQMTGAVQAVGLDPILVDVAPAACYNAARANHVGDEDCAMVLNIGGRSTNLLFADRTRFFARTIPIAGHSITQQIGKEFGIGFAEAEELKRKHGFVALGGAYAEPESEVAAAVSKIIRTVMSRLHGEINRSISVYRAHQKGNRPVALYLTGGSSAMTYTDHFFAEKLRMEVDYLNPFQVLNIGPSVDRQRLQEVAHMFSEVIGLGLRYKTPCPIEVSLIPETIRRQQALKRKKPFVVASMVCILVVLLVALLANHRRAALYGGVHDVMEGYIVKLDTLNKQIKEAIDRANSCQSRYDDLNALLEQRERWPQLLNELYRIKPANVWLVKIRPLTGEMKPIEEGGSAGGRGGGGGMGMGAMGGDDMAMADAGGGGQGMGEGGMFGDAGGGFGGGGGGFSGAGAGQVVQITGLEVYGHSVMAESGSAELAPAGTTPGAGGKKTSLGGSPLPGTALPTLPGNAASGGGGGEGAEPNPGQGGDAAGGTGQDRGSTATPEQVFVGNIRTSELFDGDGSFTGIKSYEPPSIVRNLSGFTIRIKLANPLEYYEVKKR